MTAFADLPAHPLVQFPLPHRVEGLRRLAYNLYWCWHPRAIALFKRIDPHIWSVARNPIPVLQGKVDWGDLLDNSEFMAEYETVLREFDAYMTNQSSTWFARTEQGGKVPKSVGLSTTQGPVAYFCAEYGLHEHLGIYSGGLGVLAGDHLKTTSDMGLPFVAIGLFYRQGYFRQTIDAEGHQEHAYPFLEPEKMPIQRVEDPKTGRPLDITLELPGRTVTCALWIVRVGRVPLLLLDTDSPENAAADRPITAQLYVRGREMRLYQELVLGVGGVRALHALGIEPSAWHLNEGHSAFMLVERIRKLTKAGTPFGEAVEKVRSSVVFTIHTPVSAGNEKFDSNLVRRLTKPLLEGTNTDIERVLELGRGEGNDPRSFDMTGFSLRMSIGSNAVSQLHAAVANGTWRPILGGKEILGVTNGVHMPTWLGQSLRWILEDVGMDLEDISKEQSSGKLQEHIAGIEDKKLWEGHQRQKLELAFFLKSRLRKQLARHGESPETLGDVERSLDPNILTIGFARRFATYKRASLLFSDEDRVARLLYNQDRPVQIVFAGKAHPADRPGQRMIQELFQRSRSDRFRNRVFVVEDYDMRVGRFLVEGVDVWLNTPRRPLEASGTSGMKAGANGCLNCSILDGWWDEGYDGKNGWAIGGRESNPDEGAQDRSDAESLYQALEREVIPLYYQRDERGVPTQWIDRMRHSIASTVWRFSTARMIEEYCERLYFPAAISKR